MNDPAVLTNNDFHATMESAWKESFLSLMRPVITSELVMSGNYSFSSALPNFLRDYWAVIQDCTVIDPFRLGRLLDLLYMARLVKGDIVECGTFRGGSGILMALALKRLHVNKTVHLFDSFQGLPQPHADKDKGYKKGQFTADYEACRSKITELGLENRIKIYKGWFTETVPAFAASTSAPISLLHIDCDLYTSTWDCFSHLYPKVSQSGIVVLDDFNDGGRGEKVAVLELIQRHPELIHVGPAPQCFFRKGQVDSRAAMVVTDGVFKYSFDGLFDDAEYIAWLNEVMQDDYRERVSQFLLKDLGVTLHPSTLSL